MNYYYLKSYDYDLIESSGFEKQVLNEMYESALKVNESLANNIMQDYKVHIVNKVEAYRYLKMILNSREFV